MRSMDYETSRHPVPIAVRQPTKPGFRIFATLTLGACLFLPGAQAQSANPAAIRVESDAVRIPVIVLDKARLNEIHGMTAFQFVQQVNAPDSDLIEGVFVSGLATNDFRVLEDGLEQRVERVTFEISPEWTESADRPEAAFGAQIGSVSIQMPDWPRYLVGYTQPPSPEGSCHKVSVEVNRPGVLVYSQHLYCNRPDWLEDPLKGTKLGHEMQKELNSRKAGKIKLSVAAFPRLATGAEASVDVILAFPAISRQLKDCNKPPSVGYLGAAYDEASRTVAVRFSGMLQGDLNNALGQTSPILLPTESTSCAVELPSLYKTEIRMAPGAYELKLALRDGKNFGRAEIPVNVEKIDPSHLAISQIALGKGFQKISGASESAYDKYQPLVVDGYEIVPIADPQFGKGRMLSFYLELHTAQSSVSARTVKVQLQIADAKTRRAVKSINPIAAANYAKPGDPVIPIGGGINISDLPTGAYILEARANDSAGDSTPWRTANFGIGN